MTSCWNPPGECPQSCWLPGPPHGSEDSFWGGVDPLRQGAGTNESSDLTYKLQLTRPPYSSLYLPSNVLLHTSAMGSSDGTRVNATNTMNCFEPNLALSRVVNSLERHWKNTRKYHPPLARLNKARDKVSLLCRVRLLTFFGVVPSFCPSPLSWSLVLSIYSVRKDSCAWA